MKSPRFLWIGVAGVLLGCGLGLMQRWKPLVMRLPDGRWVFPWGLKINANSDKPGDPSQVEKDFKLIYRSILAFREKNKRLPYAPQELVAFEAKSSSPKLTDQNLTGPDIKDSDEYSSGFRDHLGYLFDLRGKRPDGSPKPAFPKPGERDAWVSTNTYVRTNAVVYPNHSVSNSPQGFFIVLWSDGKIERIPEKDQVWVAVKDGLEGHYPGQTGIPKFAIKSSQMGVRYSQSAPPNIGAGPK